MCEASRWGTAWVERTETQRKKEAEKVLGQKDEGSWGFVDNAGEKDIGLGGQIRVPVSRVGETW